MKDKGANFVVRYRMPFYFSMVVWVFGWGIIWNILPNNGQLPKDSPGPWFDALFWVCIIVVNGLLGPILALKYSVSIVVSNGQLIVRRFFGLLSRDYKLGDISSFSVSAPSGKMPSADVLFMNGDKLYVSGYALRFQDFCSSLASR
jgi:hypothetical protein